MYNFGCEYNMGIILNLFLFFLTCRYSKTFFIPPPWVVLDRNIFLPHHWIHKEESSFSIDVFILFDQEKHLVRIIHSYFHTTIYTMISKKEKLIFVKNYLHYEQNKYWFQNKPYNVLLLFLLKKKDIERRIFSNLSIWGTLSFYLTFHYLE